MLSDTVIIAGMVFGFTTAGLISLIVMGGLYFITAMKQEQLNIRENLRTQKALAVAQFNAGDDGQQPDQMMQLVQMFAPMIMARGQAQQQQQTAPVGAVGVESNGKES